MVYESEGEISACRENTATAGKDAGQQVMRAQNL